MFKKKDVKSYQWMKMMINQTLADIKTINNNFEFELIYSLRN